MNNAAIGVFDSGLGGLTSVKKLRHILPGENIVYFGDTGRVPYGSRGRDIIIQYTKQDIAFLLSMQVKFILAACGTVSSTFPQSESAALPVPFLGVVQPAAKAAARLTKTGRIGIIGTETTIASGSYEKALLAVRAGTQCFSAACPLFVPLVENGHFEENDAMAALAIEEYLAPLRRQQVDTLILGCTHYPLLRPAIAAFMGPQVTLVDAGREAALVAQAQLKAADLLADAATGGTTRYYVSDDAAKFGHLAGIFLEGTTDAAAQRINIDSYKP